MDADARTPANFVKTHSAAAQGPARSLESVRDCGYSARTNDSFATGHRYKICRAGIGFVQGCGDSARTHDSFATWNRYEI